MAEAKTGQDQVAEAQEEALRELAEVGDRESLQEWRNRYLGRNGRVTQILRSIGSLPAEERAATGQAANQLKSLLQERHDEKEAEIEAASGPEGAIDVTLPGRRPRVGRLHPTTQMIREITSAFNAMGFQTVEGPEVELDEYNFNKLNIPEGHPARDLFDTLWLDRVDENGDRSILLRTHTSPMQARAMEKQEPPVRVVVPGRCYRYEATDATHEWHFHQVEGLAVDTNITFSDLKGTLYDFARRIFGSERKIRFRCDFFPFVEPGVDVAVDLPGKGWLEIMGAGMVHPNVLRAVGYDPERYTGFAFGMG
ncbi:MAG: phenylalanine--tRNA ligase subunit alpha, partial [Chloroflexota bacterium]